jgi:predicted transcriptional regulator
VGDPSVELQHLGFSEYEARAYTALLGRSPLNGYELAKVSGLPRANVYAVLRKLEERGAIFRLDTPDGTRYAPVSPDELMKRLRRHFQDVLDSAQCALDRVSSPAEYEPVWNARGYAVLLEHARALLDAAKHQLLVALWPEEAAALADRLAQAEERGVEVTTLCLAACPEECGGCRGRIHRYGVAQAQPNRWLVLVPDRGEVLAGEIRPGEQALAVRTRQRLLVELAAWYIRHSIALAAMVTDLGSRLKDLLQPETLAVLASVGPGGSDGGWLEHMARLLSGPAEPTDDESTVWFKIT